MAALGNLAVGDPRIQDVHTRQLHDPNVTFEEYAYYAALSRAEEERMTAPSTKKGLLSVIFPNKGGTGALTHRNVSEKEETPDTPATLFNSPNPGREKHLSEEKYEANDVKSPDPNRADSDNHSSGISDSEWLNANRALRTATSSAAFYLITTDILGPFGLPYAFASLGWGPGVVLFTIFAALAGYSGYLLWQIFMGMDSLQHPIKSYGDMGFRLYGRWMRYLFNILQGIQLLLNVGLIVISNGEALSQAVKFKLCFAICCLLWAIAGFVVGQVRTLQKFGFLANAAIWINIIVMIVSMVGVATSGPNYAGAAISAGAGIGNGESATAVNGVFPPILHFANIPPSSSGFAGTVNGAMQAVFSYGGAMVFPEFMAEMRRPRDFLKGMWTAQAFIYFVYMFYGLFLYGYQGQYVINPSYLGVSGYVVQTIGNVFAMISAIIAAALYGNIGIKVLYNNIFVEIFRAPALETKKGKIAWAMIIPIYWSIAFVIAAGIPDFSGLTGVVAAFCILHFTYTFPPLLSIAYLIKTTTMPASGAWDPVTKTVTHDNRGFSRIVKGFFGRRWYMNVLNLLYMLGALALSGLGAYGSITNLINAFAGDTVNSFVCESPLDGAL